MTRLILFQDGPKDYEEFVVIHTNDSDGPTELRTEYGAEPAEEVYLPDQMTSWPTDRALLAEE